nr:hypothetical protein [Actinomycetota bacterium]
VLASSGPDEKSHERENCQHQYLRGDSHAHGAFTFQLLEGLSGQAASDGENVTLHDLHSFVEQELSGQQVTFFGSGLQHSKQIRLVRAIDYANIAKRLSDAEQMLQTQGVQPLFAAIRALKEIQGQTGSNQKAIALKKTIDDRLATDRDNVTFYLTTKKWELQDHCPTTCKKVELVLANITFEVIVATDPGLLGLLLGLWEASARPDDLDEFKTLLSQMTSFEKRSGDRSQIVTPKDHGLSRTP